MKLIIMKHLWNVQCSVNICTLYSHEINYNLLTRFEDSKEYSDTERTLYSVKIKYLDIIARIKLHINTSSSVRTITHSSPTIPSCDVSIRVMW